MDIRRSSKTSSTNRERIAFLLKEKAAEEKRNPIKRTTWPCDMDLAALEGKMPIKSFEVLTESGFVYSLVDIPLQALQDGEQPRYVSVDDVICESDGKGHFIRRAYELGSERPVENDVRSWLYLYHFGEPELRTVDDQGIRYPSVDAAMMYERCTGQNARITLERLQRDPNSKPEVLERLRRQIKFYSDPVAVRTWFEEHKQADGSVVFSFGWAKREQ